MNKFVVNYDCLHFIYLNIISICFPLNCSKFSKFVSNLVIKTNHRKSDAWNLDSWKMIEVNIILYLSKQTVILCSQFYTHTLYLSYLFLFFFFFFALLGERYKNWSTSLTTSLLSNKVRFVQIDLLQICVTIYHR